MNNEDPIFEQWLSKKRSDKPPELPRDFSERILQRLESAKPIVVATPKIWLLRSAAIIVAGVIGFLRFELFTHLIISAG